MGPIKQVYEGGYECVRPKREQRMIYMHPGSVLFPKEFGGKDAQIDVDHYEDYGRFKGKDIYGLVADWNRKWLSEHPEWVKPSEIRHEDDCGEARPIGEKPWYPFYADLSLSPMEVSRKWKESKNDNGYYFAEYRSIGIDIACYDDDNAALQYPIKIARHKVSVYEECPPSLSDPYQGFEDWW